MLTVFLVLLVLVLFTVLLLILRWVFLLPARYETKPTSPFTRYTHVIASIGDHAFTGIIVGVDKEFCLIQPDYWEEWMNEYDTCVFPNMLSVHTKNCVLKDEMEDPKSGCV